MGLTMVPIELMIPSAQLALASKLFDPHDQIYDMKALKDKKTQSKPEVAILSEKINNTITVEPYVF